MGVQIHQGGNFRGLSGPFPSIGNLLLQCRCRVRKGIIKSPITSCSRRDHSACQANANSILQMSGRRRWGRISLYCILLLYNSIICVTLWQIHRLRYTRNQLSSMTLPSNAVKAQSSVMRNISTGRLNCYMLTYGKPATRMCIIANLVNKTNKNSLSNGR